MAIKGVEIGVEYRFAKTVGETDVTLFAGLTGDFSDTHINDQYMKERSNLGCRIAHRNRYVDWDRDTRERRCCQGSRQRGRPLPLARGRSGCEGARMGRAAERSLNQDVEDPS